MVNITMPALELFCLSVSLSLLGLRLSFNFKYLSNLYNDVPLYTPKPRPISDLKKSVIYLMRSCLEIYESLISRGARHRIALELAL